MTVVFPPGPPNLGRGGHHAAPHRGHQFEADKMSEMDFFEQLESAKRPFLVKKPWMEEKKFVLVTRENLVEAIDACIASGLYAIDVESTGLDNRAYGRRTNCPIVGVCMSPDGVTGYYIPLRHRAGPEGTNLPVSLVEGELRRLFASPARSIFHNAKFDHEFFQFTGSNEPLSEFDDPKKWEDTLILAYIRDVHAKNKGLKHLSKTMLGMEMFELEELYTEEELVENGYDFSVLDPTWEPALWYGGSDAICTYLLYKRLRDEALLPYERGSIRVPSQETIYTIEKLCVAATRWMERCRIPINREKVKELVRVAQREWLPALTEVYTEAGRILGRDITPGFVRLLGDKNGSHYFNPEIVDTPLKDRIDAARISAKGGRMDPVGPDGEFETFPKSMPKLTETKGVETVDFPIVYDILIPDQMGLLFRELGVPGLAVTAMSGKEDAAGRMRPVQIKTSKDELDKVIEAAGEQYTFIPKIKRFREVAKALASNLQPILDDSSPENSPDSTIKINFEAFKTDTGRFSTPQPREKQGFTGTARWNLHSIPAGYDTKRPECMQRLREVIEAPEGWTLVAVDYSGQELRLATNLSGEPLWLTEFFRCSSCDMEFNRDRDATGVVHAPPVFCPRCGSDKIGDLHSLTAVAVYGEGIKADPKDYKAKRQKAKGLNFALCYGGGGQAAMRSVNCSKEEGWRIKNQFDKTYKTLAGWWKRQHEYARATGVILTGYNRRVHLPDITSADGGFRSKAERNAVNAPIQGSGADIMKFAMGLIYKEFKKRGWLETVRMIITIHDELVFMIRNDLLQEALPVIREIMTVRATAKLQFRVPLTCDIEAGRNWTVPWNLTKIEYGKEAMPPELAHYLSIRVKGSEGGEVPPSEPKESHATSNGVSEPAAPIQEAVEHTHPPVIVADAATPVSPPPRVPVKMESPKVAPGDTYVHKISQRDLTLKMVGHIARVIHRSKGRGPHPLRIVIMETGEVVWDDPSVLVNPTEVSVLISMPEAWGS